MKIAILSDFHLGYERFREDAYRQAQEALSKAADMADMIVIPGDIFDNRTPKPDVIAEAITLFKDISKRQWAAQVVEFSGEGRYYTNTPVIAIPGTHERRAQDAVDPVDLLGLTGLVVDISNATVVVQKGSEKVAVVGIGGIADERFGEVVAAAAPQPVPGAFSVFMFHESIYELLPFNLNFMKQDELPEGFDLYVCGHIHSPVDSQVHGKKFLIPGSTVLTQLKAGEQDKKGFYIYDTLSGKYEFVQIVSRRFVMLKFSIDEIEQAKRMEYIEDQIDKAIGNGGDRPIIRVMIESKAAGPSDTEIDINALPKRYQDRAIVEVSRAGLDLDLIKSAGAEISPNIFENVSVKDYGIGVFLAKIKEKGVTFDKVSPVDLFDVLSTEGSKEKAVNSAIKRLME